LLFWKTCLLAVQILPIIGGFVGAILLMVLGYGIYRIRRRIRNGYW